MPSKSSQYRPQDLIHNHPTAIKTDSSFTSNCLTRNNYNDAKCQDVVKALYECCDAFYHKNGDDASTPSCPKPSLLRLKMKQMNQGE
ncbi:Cx9C motif-containing protein 4, mitochondrial [Metarhizium anisopliae]